jgi:hypothetical protein
MSASIRQREQCGRTNPSSPKRPEGDARCPAVRSFRGQSSSSFLDERRNVAAVRGTQCRREALAAEVHPGDKEEMQGGSLVVRRMNDVGRPVGDAAGRELLNRWPVTELATGG